MSASSRKTLSNSLGDTTLRVSGSIGVTSKDAGINASVAGAIIHNDYAVITSLLACDSRRKHKARGRKLQDQITKQAISP